MVKTARRVTGAEDQYSITFKVSTESELLQVNNSCIQSLLYPDLQKMTIFMLFAHKTNHRKCVCGVSWHFNALRNEVLGRYWYHFVVKDPKNLFAQSASRSD